MTVEEEEISSEVGVREARLFDEDDDGADVPSSANARALPMSIMVS